MRSWGRAQNSRKTSVRCSDELCVILRCGDGSLYTGWTNDLDARLEAHRSGRGAKYTRSHLPVELAYCEEHETKEAAMSREWQIKRLTRQQKLALIEKK